MSRSKIAMSESAKKEQQGATGARLRPLLPLKEAAPASHGEGAGEERAATTRDRLESELLDGREAAPRTSEARLMARLGGAGRRPATSRERLAVQLKERRSEAAREELVDEVASAGLQGPSTALPHLDRIQRAFGRHDVGGVKAHLDGGAAAANDRLGAHAYARGEHVAFARSPSLHTAAHEAAHVVQQRAGVSLSRGVGRAGDGYEQQADRVADHVVAGRSVEPLLDGVSGRGAGPRANAGSGGGVQMDIDEQKKGLADTVIGGAGGVASAGGGTSSLAGSISGMAHNTTAASGAASSASGFGGAGGIIGVAGAVSEGVEGGRDIHFDQQRGAAQQVLGGGARLTTAAGTAVSSAASATQNIATLAGNAGAAATAGMVGAGAAIAIGASEMAGGIHSAVTGQQRLTAVRGAQAQMAGADLGMLNARRQGQAMDAASEAAHAQETRRNMGVARAVKGGLLVAGGITAAVLGLSNPIGWGLLAGAALVGGIAAAISWFKSTKHKRSVVAKALVAEGKLGSDWEQKEANIVTRSLPGFMQRGLGLNRSPLDVAVEKTPFPSVAEYYDHLLDQQAAALYIGGIKGDQEGRRSPEIQGLIRAMGFTVDAEAGTPDQFAIKRALAQG